MPLDIQDDALNAGNGLSLNKTNEGNLQLHAGNLSGARLSRHAAPRKKSGINDDPTSHQNDQHRSKENPNASFTADSPHKFVNKKNEPSPIARSNVNGGHMLATSGMDAIRRLRASLSTHFSHQERHSHAIAVTSSCAREGRSLLLANLALSFSYLGKKTLVIDADLRNPRQHLLFSIENGMGFADVLCGHNLESVIRPTVSNDLLHVVPAGYATVNPEDLLGRNSFVDFIAYAKSRFDLILIDSPAFSQGGDAQRIAQVAQEAIVLARKHTAKSFHLKEMVRMMQTAQVELVGAVLNQF